MDPKYFETIKVRLLRGRFFQAKDPTGPPVAIINQAMARRCWPNQDPVGKRFGDGQGHWLTVVGVIASMRQTSLADEPDMESYMPHVQSADADMALVVRTAMDPMRLAPAIRAAVRELDKDLPVSEIGTLANSISHSTRSQRFSVALLGAFAALALLLASVGVYGVISCSVARRTHEIGVRLALGAERGAIVGMVVGRALLLWGRGCRTGCCGRSSAYASSTFDAIRGECHRSSRVRGCFAVPAGGGGAGRIFSGAPSGTGRSDGRTAPRIRAHDLHDMLEW